MKIGNMNKMKDLKSRINHILSELITFKKINIMKRILLLVILTFTSVVNAQVKEAYALYNKDGVKVSYEAMLEEAGKADVLLFGELHNNSIAHWLQYEVTKDLSEKRKLILGAEMLEADNQKALNDYLSGIIDRKALDTMARLWPNYSTDYAPLVDFALTNKLDFIATNIPRKFASKVHRGGFEALDALTEEEKSWVAPLPIPYDAELATYKNILEMMGEHGTPELVKAQAIKDATMAHFIVENWKKKHLFIHYNGRYHSDYYEGIGWYLQKYAKGKKVVTITTVEQADINGLMDENKGVADFVICVDEDVTKTY